MFSWILILTSVEMRETSVSHGIAAVGVAGMRRLAGLR